MPEIEIVSEEVPSVEEEFRDLSQSAQETIDKLNNIATRLEKKRGEPATNGELAGVLRLLSGDLTTVVKDSINSCGSAFSEVFEALSDGDDDDEDEDDEDGGTVDDETVDIYINLKAVYEALQRWASAPKEATVEQYRELANLTSGSIGMLEENFGDAIKEQAAIKIQEVQNALNGVVEAEQQ